MVPEIVDRPIVISLPIYVSTTRKKTQIFINAYTGTVTHDLGVRAATDQ
jgi:hypothetical protein